MIRTARVIPFTAGGFVLLLVWTTLIAVSCGSADDEKKSEPVSFLVPGVVHFQTEKDGEDAYTEALFEQAARKAFQKVHLSNVSVKSSLLQGALQENETTRELLLSIQIGLKDISAPLVTSLHASADIERPAVMLVDKALSDLASATGGLLHLVRADSKRLAEALSSSEPDMQIFAAALIAERRIKTPSAQKELCRLLSDPREEVAEASAEALKEIGTPETVPQIIQSIQKRSLRSEVRVIEVIARIGGKEARAYLEMTAIGHEIPEVRRLSESLLKTVKDKPTR